MPYLHSGEIGDVWKHLPLCDILKIESPKRYFETNSAYAEYILSIKSQNEYGIFYLLDQLRINRLSESVYFKILKKINTLGNRIYYGSPALAMVCLNNNAEFFFHDIEDNALKSILCFSKESNIEDRVKVVCGESISIFLNSDYNFGQDDFVFIDPYMPFDGNSEGYTFFDIFKKVYSSQAKIMLWYGYDNLDGKNRISAELQNVSYEFKGPQIHTFDVWQKSMNLNSCKINPGVPGCGLAVSNLSISSITKIGEYLSIVGNLYLNAIYNNEPASLCTGYLVI